MLGNRQSRGNKYEFGLLQMMAAIFIQNQLPEIK